MAAPGGSDRPGTPIFGQARETTFTPPANDPSRASRESTLTGSTERMTRLEQLLNPRGDSLEAVQAESGSSAQRSESRTRHPRITRRGSNATPEGSASRSPSSSADSLERQARRENLLRTSPAEVYIGDTMEKGEGLFALIKIPLGTLIYCERPIFVVDRSYSELQGPIEENNIIRSKLQAIPEDKKQAFFALGNNFSDEENPRDIFRTNAIATGLGSHDMGIFPGPAKMNHSCRPNCCQVYYRNTGHLLIHAIRDIEVEEELTISYIYQPGEFLARRQELKASFSFDCECDHCHKPVAEREESERRMKRILELAHEVTQAKSALETPKRHLKNSRDLIRLYKEEGISDIRIAHALEAAFQTVAMHSDFARAKSFAYIICIHRKMCFGVEHCSLRYWKKMMKDPNNYEEACKTKMWESHTVDATGWDLPDLEAWIWANAEAEDED